jgi:F0F1-type ATP synthase epsilon subunit
MKASVIDSQQTIFEGLVTEAILPAIGGELSIMDNHEYIIVALGRGKIRLRVETRGVGVQFDADSKEMIKRGAVKPIVIRQGVARMRDNELVVLVE